MARDELDAIERRTRQRCPRNHEELQIRHNQQCCTWWRKRGSEWCQKHVVKLTQRGVGVEQLMHQIHEQRALGRWGTARRAAQGCKLACLPLQVFPSHQLLCDFLHRSLEPRQRSTAARTGRTSYRFGSRQAQPDARVGSLTPYPLGTLQQGRISCHRFKRLAIFTFQARHRSERCGVGCRCRRRRDN